MSITVSRTAPKAEVEVRTAVGTVQIVRRSWTEPIDILAEPQAHRLELALLPRSGAARAGFPDRWGPDRFEPVGELFLMPAGETIRAKSECRRQSSIVCTLAPDAVSAWFDGELDWNDGRLRGSLSIANPIVRQLLCRLGAEVQDPGFAGPTLIELMTAQIALELLRHCVGVEWRHEAGGLASWRLRLIDDRLGVLDHGPSLQELANLCGLSPRQLSRAFKVSRSRSIGAYITEQRMQGAKQLLAAGHSVKAIAARMGFGSPSNLAVAFRRSTGESPSQYRNLRR